MGGVGFVLMAQALLVTAVGMWWLDGQQDGWPGCAPERDVSHSKSEDGELERQAENMSDNYTNSCMVFNFSYSFAYTTHTTSQQISHFFKRGF